MPRISKDKKTVETDKHRRPANLQRIDAHNEPEGPHFQPTEVASGETARLEPAQSDQIKVVDEANQMVLPHVWGKNPMAPEEKAKREAAKQNAEAKAKELTETIQALMRSFDDDESFGTACDRYQALVQELAAVVIAERIRQFCRKLGMKDGSRAADLEQLDLLEKKLEVAETVRTWLAHSNLGFRHKDEYRQLFAERSGRSDAPGGRFVLKRYGNPSSKVDGRITNWTDVVDIIAEPVLADVTAFFRR